MRQSCCCSHSSCSLFNTECFYKRWAAHHTSNRTQVRPGQRCFSDPLFNKAMIKRKTLLWRGICRTGWNAYGSPCCRPVTWNFQKLVSLKRIREEFVPFTPKSIHPSNHFYLSHLLFTFYGSFHLYICGCFCSSPHFFSPLHLPPPLLPALTGADYWPDHNTDRRPAACDPSLPLLIPGLPSRSTLAFLGEKRNIDKHSACDWICTRLRVSSQLRGYVTSPRTAVKWRCSWFQWCNGVYQKSYKCTHILYTYTKSYECVCHDSQIHTLSTCQQSPHPLASLRWKLFCALFDSLLTHSFMP